MVPSNIPTFINYDNGVSHKINSHQNYEAGSFINAHSQQMPILGELTDSRVLIKNNHNEHQETYKAGPAQQGANIEQSDHRRVKSFTVDNSNKTMTTTTTVTTATNTATKNGVTEHSAQQSASGIKVEEFKPEVGIFPSQVYGAGHFQGNIGHFHHQNVQYTHIPPPQMYIPQSQQLNYFQPIVNMSQNNRVEAVKQRESLDESFQKLISKAGDILKNYEESEKKNASRENHHLSRQRHEGPLQFVGFGRPMTIYTPSPERNVISNSSIANSGVILNNGIVNAGSLRNSGVHMNAVSAGVSGIIYQQPLHSQVISGSNSQVLNNSQIIGGAIGAVIHNTTIAPTMNVVGNNGSVRNSFGIDK